MSPRLTVLALLVLLVLPISAGAAAAENAINLGPYLQNPAVDGVTVMFRTTRPGTYAVAYGTNEKQLDRSAAAAPGKGDTAAYYKARLDGLRPGTTYYYHVAGGKDQLTPVHRLTTLDPQAGAVTALFFNDLHDNLALAAALKPQWKDVAADFMLLNGDCLADPKLPRSPETLAGLLSIFPAAERPMLMLRGNHEWRGSWSASLMNCFDLPHGGEQKFYFAFTQGPVRFVCLDCGEDDEKRLDYFRPYREEQLRWIKAEVASAAFQKARYRVLVMHIPLYNKSAAISPPCHRLWSPTLDEAKIDLCIAGHDHIPRLLTPHDKAARRDKVLRRDNPYPVMIGGGPKLSGTEAGTVIVLQADAQRLHARMIGVGGKTLFQYQVPPPAGK